MGFRNGAYATVWEIAQTKNGGLQGRISTQRKNKQTNEYEQDFSGYCYFCGNAQAKLKALKTPSRIVLGEVEVTNRYDKEAKRDYESRWIYSFSLPDETGSRNNTPSASIPTPPAPTKTIEENPMDGDVSDDCPF